MPFVLTDDDSETADSIKTAFAIHSVEGDFFVCPKITDLLDFIDHKQPLNDQPFVLFLNEEIHKQDTLVILRSLKETNKVKNLFVVVLTNHMFPAKLRRAYTHGANS